MDQVEFVRCFTLRSDCAVESKVHKSNLGKCVPGMSNVIILVLYVMSTCATRV